MKMHIGDISAGIGIVTMAIGAYVLFSITTVLAEHNDNERSHPTSIQAVAAVASTVELVILEARLNQESTKAALNRSEEADKQILALLADIRKKL